MIFEQRNFLLKSVRIILDDKALRDVLEKKTHSYISGLSYNWQLMSDKSVHIKTKQTTVIKLSGDYFSRFNDTTRNEVRRTEKMSEMSFRVPDENRRAIYELYKNFERSAGRIVRKREYFGKSLLCGAYLDSELAAAVLCYDAYPYLRAHAIVSSHAHQKLKSFALRRLVFEICKYGQQHSYMWFDLGGINTHDPKKAGITAFKLGFGGDTINDYHYTYKSLTARLLEKVFFRTAG